MVSSPKKFLTSMFAKKRLSMIAIMAVVIFSQVMPGFSTLLQVPLAKADSWSFNSMFEDCTDDSSEQTWSEIKACLANGALSSDVGTYILQNAVQPKLEPFYDSHGLNIPPALGAKPYVWNGTPPSESALDTIISAYLSEEFRDSRSRAGADALQTIGTAFDDAINLDENGLLCWGILAVPVGSPSRNTNELPAPYDSSVAYGPDHRGDMPRCTVSDVMSTDERPYLIRGFAVANLYTVADIIASDPFNPLSPEDRASRPDKATTLAHIKATMNALKEYLMQPPARALIEYDGNSYVDLAPFLAQYYTRDPGHDGPIENMLETCQGDSAVRAADNNASTSNYVALVSACYRAHLPTIAQAREFVNDILIPATDSLANEYRGWTGSNVSNKALLRQFMNSYDYVQLGEGYDPLATQRYDYRLEDYLNETINDGYTDSISWTIDTDLVNLPVTGVSELVRSALDNAVKWPILKHLKAVNTALIAHSTTYLDRPLPPAPAVTTPSAPATTGTTIEQNRQTFGRDIGQVRRTQSVSRKNVFQQMNNYIDATLGANKKTLLFAWYYLAVKDHDPGVPDMPGHTTGDLSLLVEDKPATGRWDSTFSDPFLAKMTNACSPNVFLDTISKEDLPVWKGCLEYERDYVDHSNTNRAYKLHSDGSATAPTYTLTLADSEPPFNMQRSEPVRAALQELIVRIDACAVETSPCLSMNDHDEGSRANDRAGLPDNHRDTGNALLNSILSFINVLLALAIKFLFWLCAMVMSLFQAVLSYTGFTTTSFVVTMWKAVRDFVNLFFILALLLIAVANIVQYQINNYAIKTVLPKLILIVLAVNFSRLFVGVVIDAANVVEAGVYQVGGMGPHGAGTSQERCSQYTPDHVASGGITLANIPDDVKQGSMLCRLAQGLKFEQMQQYVAEGTDPSSQVDFFYANAALLLMSIMIFFGFLALAITFTIRIIILWALAITSPLYVVSQLFPFTQSIGGQWQSKFFKYATMHVAVAFFMTLAVLAADTIVPDIFSTAMRSPSGVAGSHLGPAGFQSLADYLKLIFIMAMVYGGVFTAAKGDYAQGMIDKIAGWGSPSSVWNASKKAAGLGYGLSQGFGNYLRDANGKYVGRLMRGAGMLISMPSNTIGGAKAIFSDIQDKAKEREKRFSLQRAESFSRDNRAEKFRSLLASHRETQIAEIEKLETNRFDTQKLIMKGGELDKAIASGDIQALQARGRILASKGDLNLNQVMANGKSLRDNMRELMTANGIRPDEIDSALERMSDANLAAVANKGNKEAQRVSGAGLTPENYQRLVSARKKKQAAEFVGMLTKILGSGRVADAVQDPEGNWGKARDEGTGLGMQEFLLALNDGVAISADDWRSMNKKVAGESMGMFGVHLKNKELFEQYLTGRNKDSTGGVFAAAQQLGFLTEYNTYQEAMASNEREQVAKIMGHLATEGSWDGRSLEDSSIGRDLIALTRKTHAENVPGIKLEGDDDRIAGFVKQMQPAAFARAINSTVETAPNMVVRAFEALAQNVAKAKTPEAEAFNRLQLDQVTDSVAQITTTQSQIDRMTALIGQDLAAKLAAQRQYQAVADDPSAGLNAAGQSIIDTFNAKIVQVAKNKHLEKIRLEEIEKEKARRSVT